MFKVATWNVNSIRSRLEHVVKWVTDNKPDVLALQETKTPDDAFPKEALESAGYHVIFSGQKSYNGVAILSQKRATDVVTDLPGIDNSQRRVLVATIAGIRIVNVYVPNGSEVGSDKYHYKLEWLKCLRDYVTKELKKHPKLLIMGDFNIAPEDRDVYDPEAWEGNVLVSEPERAALRELLSLGLNDAFRLFDEESGGYSWWDYRLAAFVRDAGMRLDLVLLTDALARVCRRCAVDREPRGWEKPSDHAPVIAEFE